MKTNQITSESTDNRTETFVSSEFSSNKKRKIIDNPLISVIIPLFNEENTIKDVIVRIPNHQKYEIIIVDDGSTDNSVKKIQEINNREIKIIKHEKNQGYGAALLSGFESATGDIIITIDSDGQHNPEEIPILIKPILNKEADLVIGSRFLGKCHYKMPLYARAGAYFVNLFLWLLFLQKVYDNQCGFRAFKKDIVKIAKNIRNTGMGFSTEILFKAAYYSYRVAEIPVSINSRTFGASYVNLIKIFKSISSCILFYIMKKFKLKLKNLFSKNSFI